MTSQPLDLILPRCSIALLVDADNIPPSALGQVVTRLSPLGQITVRRAYGDWSRAAMSSWSQPLTTHAFRAIQQSTLVKGKNATDMALVIEAMELLFTQRPSAIGIASSDSDFAPLALRLREYGLAVYGLGEAKAPASFRNACTQFYELPPKPASTKPTLAGNAQLTAQLQQAVAAQANTHGWAMLSAVGSDLGKAKTISPKDHGAANYSKMFQATGLFAIEKAANGQTYIADKRNKARSPIPA
jgi:hypothetical protein